MQERPQTRLGPQYQLGEAIAADGVGTLHAAVYVGQGGFRRPVAIKRLRPQFSTDPEFVRVLVAGARLAARIRHPNVVATLDVLQEPGGLSLVTERVAGPSLGRILREQVAKGTPLPVPLACGIAAGVLEGLGAAHAVQLRREAPAVLVHGNLSPEAVVLGYDGTPRVEGFGFARAFEWLQTTREGRLRGALAYTAPEILSGSPATVQSDLFAASVMLWEALTARSLFRGAHAAELFEQVLTAPIPSPSELVPSVPVAVSEVVLRGLARAPVERFESARQMARALADANADLPPFASAFEIGDWLEQRLDALRLS